MKILVMTSYYPPFFVGGAELSCQGQVEVLRRRGHDIAVLTSQEGVAGPPWQDDIHRLLQIDRTSPSLSQTPDLCKGVRLGRRYHQIRRALSLRRNYAITQGITAKIRPDLAYIWHVQSVSVRPILAAQHLHIPIVIRLPDYWLAELKTELCNEPSHIKRWYRSKLNGLESFDRLDTTHMLPNSEILREKYMDAGFDASCMRVIPNGLSPNLILSEPEVLALPLPGRRGDVRLLFAGRLDSIKGPDIAIQTLARLLSRLEQYRATLDIIGEGSEYYQQKLRSLVLHEGLTGKVAFLGKIDHEQLLARYQNYDALLFTSRWVEPFGRVVLEAMACGLPVVSTNIGGPTELITDGVNGLLAPVDSPDLMAKAIQELILNPNLAQQIRTSALAKLRADYNLESIVDDVEEYLHEVLLDHAHRSAEINRP